MSDVCVILLYAKSQQKNLKKTEKTEKKMTTNNNRGTKDYLKGDPECGWCLLINGLTSKCASMLITPMLPFSFLYVCL